MLVIDVEMRGWKCRLELTVQGVGINPRLFYSSSAVRPGPKVLEEKVLLAWLRGED
jgi:hypothetical protein